MHDTMPRTFRLGTSVHAQPSSPLWATSSVGDTRYAENMQGVTTVRTTDTVDSSRVKRVQLRSRPSLRAPRREYYTVRVSDAAVANRSLGW